MLKAAPHYVDANSNLQSSMGQYATYRRHSGLHTTYTVTHHVNTIITCYNFAFTPTVVGV